MMDKATHDNWAAQDQREIDFTNNHDLMTENPQTEVSMLGAHRVKPYHFKGFNQGQIDNVYNQRSNQVEEKDKMKKDAKEAERQHELQMEQNRRMQIINDRKMKRNLRGV